MSQPIDAPEAPDDARSRSIAGRPTLTTEPSMKARLEPRMVAASVPVGCSVCGAVGAAEARPWSQGPAVATDIGERLGWVALRPRTAPYAASMPWTTICCFQASVSM